MKTTEGVNLRHQHVTKENRHIATLWSSRSVKVQLELMHFQLPFYGTSRGYVMQAFEKGIPQCWRYHFKVNITFRSQKTAGHNQLHVHFFFFFF